MDKLRFDNRSKNFTFDTFIDRMRECFIDMGPNDQMTETRKVSKLVVLTENCGKLLVLGLLHEKGSNH